MTLSLNTSAAGRSAALIGIGYMLVAVFLIGLSSATGKWLLAKYPVGEFLLLRSAMTLILLAPFVWRAGKAAFVNAPRPGLQIFRVLLSSAEVAMFFWVVSKMPLADAQTFYLAAPIYVTALSVLILSERVGWRRWMAVFAGFCGVVIALRPSSASFGLPALIAISGSALYALLMIVTRMLRETDDAILMTMQFLGVFLFGLLSLPFGWVTPALPDFAVFAGLGLASVLALFCVVRALKLAPASIVVPYQYTLIVWAVIFGWIVFGEFPNISTISGAAIIVLAGLYIFWRERVTSRGVSPRPETI